MADLTASLQTFLAQARRQMLPYQVAWLMDKNRFRIALKARQVRWSTTLAFEAFVGAAFRGRRQLIVSASERQAQEVLSKVKGWARIAVAAGVPVTYETESMSELHVKGGKPIISLAQNPNTIAGFSGDVTLDEFALHPRDREIYDAIAPSITAGYRLSIVSTPLGESGRFHELWSKPNAFSKHRTTIHEAIRDGLRVDLDALRSILDGESFRQSYECEFVDESTAYFPYSLILPAVGERPGGAGRVFCGVDVGRKHDLTVVYLLEQLGDKFYTRRIETLKGVDFATQKRAIRQICLEARVERGAVDATGLGMQLAEELHHELGFMESVQMTGPIKERLVTGVKRLFEDRAIQIPDDQNLIADIHAIRKTVTSSNNVRYDADRTDAGHADRFWALALAAHSAQRTNRIVTRIR